jgi:micrococcal nuclease
MYTYNAFVDRVVDGDTYDVQIDLGFGLTFGSNKAPLRLRLRGVDTPETWRPKTEAEREHGERATKFVRDLIEQQFIQVQTYKMGIYGRYEADVSVFDPELDQWVDLGQLLIDNGFVKLESYEDGNV